MARDDLILLGVRHHSPACAKWVRATLEARRPAIVLIEGPVDFNPHIEELRLGHAPPVAIFSYHADEGGARSSYTPYCAFSPEWQALQTAWRIGARPMFCDLPFWTLDGADRDADPHGLRARHAEAMARLGRELHAEGVEAAWDALVEQRAPDRVGPVLERYFNLLRPTGVVDPAEAAREAFMAAHVAAALRAAKGRAVALVCGGWHVNGVRDALAMADGAPPISPEPAPGARSGSFLTPFSYARLDRLGGYAAGMPSPGYYERLFHEGLDAAARWAGERIVATLRAEAHAVSTADRIAFTVATQALARLRGHGVALRADLFDAALSCLVKDALPAPPDWSAPTARRSDLAAVMARALSSDAVGALAPGVRRPPLVEDVARRLDGEGLRFEPPMTVEIDWRAPGHRGRAHLLHQLRLLGAPGLAHVSAPRGPDARELRDVFRLDPHPDFRARMIEASQWGVDLPSAAAACLEERLDASGRGAQAQAQSLSDALFAGLTADSDALFAALDEAIASNDDLGALAQTGRRLARLHRYGDIFGTAAMDALAPLCARARARLLWLIEGDVSQREAQGAVEAALAIRDLGGDAASPHDDAPVVFARLAAATTAPAPLAGAALGYLLSAGVSSIDGALARLRAFASPQTLGDFLGGLFALAREEIARRDDALGAIDGVVADWSQEDFLRALPALRGAFAWFAPRERERLAHTILRRAGLDAGVARSVALRWMGRPVSVPDHLAAARREARAARRLARHGLAQDEARPLTEGRLA